MTDLDTGVAHEDSPTSRARPEKLPLPLWQECIVLVVLALVLAVIIKSFFVQAFYVPSASMEPQLADNDRILVQKVSYWGGSSPSRGDIVVFADPGGWLLPAERTTSPSLLERVGLQPAGGHLVKRVIGVGGDRVVCCDKQDRVTVNGQPLDERSYLPKGTVPSSRPFDVTVPEHRLWVMGDNRENSADSRMHRGLPAGGSVAESTVIGKVIVLMWPWSRAGLIHRPSTFENIPEPG